MSLELIVHSEDETRALGRCLGTLLAPGDIVGLYGELGAGKTCLVRGLAEGLGILPERVRSPTFTLMSTYRGGRLLLHHVDLYRLSPSEDDRIALREVLYGDAVSAVEWFDRFGEETEHLRIEILYAGAHERRILLDAGGGRYHRLIEAVKENRWR